MARQTSGSRAIAGINRGVTVDAVMYIPIICPDGAGLIKILIICVVVVPYADCVKAVDIRRTTCA